MRVLAELSLLFTLFRGAHGDGVYFNEPPGQRREQTFRVLEFEHGSVNERYEGTLRYYCTFRGKWSKQRHPADFPKSPSWSAPVFISHSNGYRMWTGTETATLGVESIAEVSILLDRSMCAVYISVRFLSNTSSLFLLSSIIIGGLCHNYYQRIC